MKLSEWCAENEPRSLLPYARGYDDQISFVQNDILALLAETHEVFKKISEEVLVISTHTSKSVELPVFYIKLLDGTSFTMRCNFFNWKISVSSPRDVVAHFMGLFDPNAEIEACYCEGFPEESVYGSYWGDQRQFTFELFDNFMVYTFFWIYAHQVLKNRNNRDSGR